MFDKIIMKATVLIVPSGIETINKSIYRNVKDVLIVPSGIETQNRLDIYPNLLWY